MHGRWLVAIAVCSASAAARAETHGVVLGDGPPPSTLGGLPVVAFDLAPQGAIPDYTEVTTIPGSPTGPLEVDRPVVKLTVPESWPFWSHGYTGPVFAKPKSVPGRPEGVEENRHLLLPPGTRAFYVYMQGGHKLSASSGGVLLVEVPEDPTVAIGFGFYTDAVGESLDQVIVNAVDFAIGELGLASDVPVELQSFSVE
jgi:hypothetical protein